MRVSRTRSVKKGKPVMKAKEKVTEEENTGIEEVKSGALGERINGRKRQ